MATYFALLDACVLYPQTLRDLLLNLAGAGLFHGRWTERINQEWVEKLILKNPGRRPQVLRTLDLVNQSVEDCLITGYEHLIESVERNAVRANLVKRAEDWTWPSAWRRTQGDGEFKSMLSRWPIDSPPDWAARVNQPMTDQELEAIRHGVTCGTPFGSER